EILRAGADFHAAVGVNLRLGLAGLAAAAPGRAGAADTGLDAPGRAAGLLVFFLPAELLRAELVFLLAHFHRIVLDAELDGVEVHLHREVVEDRFDAERRRRAGRGAEGAGRSG